MYNQEMQDYIISIHEALASPDIYRGHGTGHGCISIHEALASPDLLFCITTNGFVRISIHEALASPD